MYVCTYVRMYVCMYVRHLMSCMNKRLRTEARKEGGGGGGRGYFKATTCLLLWLVVLVLGTRGNGDVCCCRTHSWCFCQSLVDA